MSLSRQKTGTHLSSCVLAPFRKPATSVLPCDHPSRSRCWMRKSSRRVSAGLNEFDSCIRVATATVGIGDTVPRPIANGMFSSMKRQLTRRRMLGSSAGVVAAPVSLIAAPASQRDFLKELGVRPIINGAGVYTFSTASLMRPEVVEAIRSISTKFVRLDELHDAVGQRIAKMLGAEAAMVPSGAAAGLTLGHGRSPYG